LRACVCVFVCVYKEESDDTARSLKRRDPWMKVCMCAYIYILI